MFATEILLLIFLIITFFQSGLDKLLDWSGNVAWLKGHFANTFIGKIVPLSLGIILILEIIATVLCIAGIYNLITTGDKMMAFYAAIVSSFTLFFLLLGQRIAKDYDGARTIVIYFIPTIFLVYALTH
ncbi:DoxX family protein [Lacinutrix undariae]